MDIRDSLDKAFTPAHIIDNPNMFAGRHTKLKTALRTLRSKGASYLIYGERGVGKSSFAFQLSLIAKGEVLLLRNLGLLDERPKESLPVIYFTCNDFTNNVEKLLEQIISDPDPGGVSQYVSVYSAENKKEMYSDKLGVNPLDIGASRSRGTESNKTIMKGPIDNQFKSVIREISRKHENRPVFLIIDELERLKDKTGLASLIKSNATSVRFCLVGIGTDISELVQDHASVERQLNEGTIKLEPMEKEESKLILVNAEKTLDGKLTFSPEAKDKIADDAQGYPYFVHLLGKESGYVCFDNGKKVVTIENVEEAIVKISTEAKAPLYEELYQKAVKGSEQREIVLKAFADTKQDEIYAREIYPTCRGMEVANASQEVGQLVTAGVFEKVRDEYYRFIDARFRVYAKLRPWKFKGVH